MNENLLNVINAFPDLDILVIGEAMLDSYLDGHSERLCREAPVPVVDVEERENVPGGAANTAVNISTMGGNVTFLSVVGDDTEAEVLCRALSEAGVRTEHVLREPSRRTLAKQRVLSSQQMLVRFDQGSTEPLDEEAEQSVIEHLRELYPKSHAVIVSDYNYGVLTKRIVQTLRELQQQHPHLLVVDSKRLKEYKDVGVTAIKPNYQEALDLLGLEKPDSTDIDARVRQMEEHGGRLLDITGAQIAAVTIDQDGSLVFGPERVPYRTYAHPEPNSKAAGAGDTFVSALTLALAAGAVTENAAELASMAASIAVGKDGTSACYAEELQAHFMADEKVVNDVFHLAGHLAAYRRDGKRVVFTNGCFDILHTGHINYLNRAKATGDVLIVGVNSDESVRRLKGPTRPINKLEDRSQILAALSAVDHIVPFDSDTPHNLIRVIKPDIFVKGGDYSREKLPEASLVESLGGELQILPYLENHSTTGIIERIREIYARSPS